MVKKAAKVKFGMRHEDVLSQHLKDPKFARLYYQEVAVLDVQCAVADVANRAMRRQHGARAVKDEWTYYRVLSRKLGVSRKSLKQFFNRGGGVRTAAQYLHDLGYKLKISVEKLPKIK